MENNSEIIDPVFIENDHPNTDELSQMTVLLATDKTISIENQQSDVDKSTINLEKSLWDQQSDSDEINDKFDENNIQLEKTNNIIEPNQTEKIFNDPDELPNEYIKPIYVHPSIKIIGENNYKSMVAIEDIKCGEVLIVEHVYGGTTANCCLILEYNKYLFNSYHPRITRHSETTNKLEHTIKKLELNCYGLDKDRIITDMLKYMNHSCIPNSSVHIREKYNTNDTFIVFMELISIKLIKKGSEITSSYGPETSHKRDFECKCGKELPEREKIFNIIHSLGRTFSKSNEKFTKKIIYDYLETPESKKILLNHYLATKGIYLNNDTIAAYTKDGLKLINDIIHKYLGITEEIKNSDGQIVEQSINQFKINLFMKILKDNLFT